MSSPYLNVTTSTGRELPIDPTLLTMNALLREAIENPGVLGEAYSRFHEYSLGNRLGVIIQCRLRGLEVGPFASYAAWQRLDRQVKRGEKPLLILHPMYRSEEDENGRKNEVLVGFAWKPSAFVLAQTDGEELELAELVPFDLDATLKAVNIKPVPFTHEDGNALGFATVRREISVSPLSPRPERTLFHEIGHVLLGHVEKGDVVDLEARSYSTNEVEAEAFSYLVCGMLGMAQDPTQLAESSGYIRYWMEHGAAGDWSDRNARRVMRAVDRFLQLTKKSATTSGPAKEPAPTPAPVVTEPEPTPKKRVRKAAKKNA